MTNAQVLEQLQQGYCMPGPKGCPDEFYDIMLDCWQEESACQPTFEILQWQLEDFFVAEDPGCMHMVNVIRDPEPWQTVKLLSHNDGQ